MPQEVKIFKEPIILIWRLRAGQWNGYYDGTVKEVLMFDRPLSEAEVVKINYYLANKWNLSDIVDSDGDKFTDAVEIVKILIRQTQVNYPVVFLP